MKGFCLLFCMVLIFGFVKTVDAESKQVMGFIENALVYPGEIKIPAKLDTGADNSSLNVKVLTEFARDGETWVRFQVTDSDGKTFNLERKLIRLAKIKRNGAPRQKRPVVLMGVCVGNFYKEAEVNLVDRSRFKYQLLIGRSFMKGGIVVDPALEHTVQPQCPQEKLSLE
ncbi:MAG: ATP-dependent zinc protease [Desulfomonile tiedjei]|nr:ATP-dependent zinc protease [Desulfomonile tiedjei]